MRAPARSILLARAEASLAYAATMLIPPADGRRFARGRAIAAADALLDSVRALRLSAEKRDG